MRRLVLDTSVVVAALRSRLGASNAVLRLVADGTVTPLVTTALFLEYEDVLGRDEQRAVHGLPAEEVGMFLSEFAALCEPVEVHFRWRPQATDPSDDLVLEAAVNGRADAIVTHNVRHLARPGARFGVAVITPGQFFQQRPR